MSRTPIISMPLAFETGMTFRALSSCTRLMGAVLTSKALSLAICIKSWNFLLLPALYHVACQASALASIYSMALVAVCSSHLSSLSHLGLSLMRLKMVRRLEVSVSIIHWLNLAVSAPASLLDASLAFWSALFASSLMVSSVTASSCRRARCHLFLASG